MMRPTATCRTCKREDTPLKKNYEFMAHYPRGGGRYCYGDFKPHNFDPRTLKRNSYAYRTYFNNETEQILEKAVVRATSDYYEERIRRTQELKARMADAEIARLERLRDLALEKELEKEESYRRFGRNEDYADGAIIAFKYRYGSGGLAYSFVAIKAGKMGGWYTSNKVDRNWYTWDELIETYLSKAVEVCFVTEVEEM